MAFNRKRSFYLLICVGKAKTKNRTTRGRDTSGKWNKVSEIQFDWFALCEMRADGKDGKAKITECSIQVFGYFSSEFVLSSSSSSLNLLFAAETYTLGIRGLSGNDLPTWFTRSGPIVFVSFSICFFLLLLFFGRKWLLLLQASWSNAFSCVH